MHVTASLLRDPEGKPECIIAILQDITERKRIEAALRQSEEQFRATFEQAAVGMVHTAPDGRWLRVNDRFCAITGYTREELLSFRFYDITHPDDVAADREWQRALLAGELTIRRAEKRIVRKDETIVWVNVTASLLRDTDGESKLHQAVFEDITERKRIEAALQKSEEHFRATFEQAAVGMVHTGPDGRWLRVNDRFCAITGYTREELLSFRFYDITHPDDVKADFEQKQALRAGQITIRRAEKRLLHKDGRVIWVHVTASLLHDPDGGSERILGVIEDITERKRIEAALQKSEEQFRATFEQAAVGMVHTAPDGRWLRVNDRFCAIIGYSREELLVRRCSELTHPDDVPTDDEQKRALLAGEIATRRVEKRFVRKDGSIVWVHVTSSLLSDPDGGPVRMIGVIEDITERKRAEAELHRLTETLEDRVREEVAARQAAQARAAHAERLQALGQLAGGIAHDFNNVLQAVSGAVGLIERRPGNEASIRRWARRAIEAAERGADITRRLLTFGRRADLRAEPVDAAALLLGLREILAHTLGAGIVVRVGAEAGLPPLLVDKGQLETVLINLATNARDAMPGGGQLILAAETELVADDDQGQIPRLAPGCYVRLTVADAGIGMDAATLARADEPFFTTKTAGSGTGLGLPMARGFAEQSGGALSIESSPGQGTTVTLWLPADASQYALSSPEELKAAASTGKPPNSIRVMLVDDEDMVRETMAEYLEGEGFRVLVATNATEALALLAAGEMVDAMVTDLSMPGMNGLALIHTAQERHPGLPAMLLTGYASDDDGLLAEEAGCGVFALLRKPVSGNQLIGQLHALLGERPGAGG